jgi:hypothetical protein
MSPTIRGRLPADNLNLAELSSVLYPDESRMKIFKSTRQRAVNPPSIIKLCPVTNDALPEHSHKTASATSST